MQAVLPHTALQSVVSSSGLTRLHIGFMKGGLWSPREDITTLEQKFKKSYIDERYSLDEAEKKFAEWDKLMQQLFIRRK